MIKKSKYQDLIWFIDNTEDCIVLEIEAEYCEWKFMQGVETAEHKHVGYVWTERLIRDLGLGINWGISKQEYTGETYIVTVERLWA